jgi:hypothetical protein
MVYYGKYDFNAVMQMPVNLRSYLYAKLDSIIKRENEIKEVQSQQNFGMVQRR